MWQNNMTIFEMFELTEPTKSWEVGHCQYGHISYNNLQKLYDLKLVYHEYMAVGGQTG